MTPPSAITFLGGPLDGQVREVQRDAYGALPRRVSVAVLSPDVDFGAPRESVPEGTVPYRDVCYELRRLETGGAVYVGPRD